MVGIVWVLSAFFAVSGAVKVTGKPVALADRQLNRYFRPYGFNERVMRAIGVIEVIGAVAVWFYDTDALGLAAPTLLVAITLGAIFFHIRNDRVRHAVPATIMFVLSLTVLMVAGAGRI